MKMKSGEKSSVKWKMLRLLLTSWLIPLLLIFIVFAYYILSNHLEGIVNSYVEQLQYNLQFSVQRLNAAVDASRAASYDKTIRNSWEAYKKEENSYYNMFKECEKYLKTQYQRNAAFCGTILWFYENPGKETCSVYNESTGGTYQDIQKYWKSDHEQVMELAAELDTGVGFCNIDGRMYMVRNIVNSSYDLVAALVMRLNEDYCFGNLKSIPLAEEICIQINGQTLLNDGLEEWPKQADEESGRQKSGSFWEKSQLFVYARLTGSGYQIRAAIEMAKSMLLFPFYGWQYIFCGMLVALIGLLWIFIRTFRRQIQEPVKALMHGAEKIEKGELGFQLEQDMGNLEFRYLQDSFNRMSVQLQNYFNRIYKEEIALRDARIMALQAHINPHFLNNTLEIINWEARLSGNDKISRMIESLSVLMDAAMDRQKRPEVSLEEELKYVDAYLYITKERLGKRLTIRQEISEELFPCLVPRLILQPVIENAVKHGIIPKGKGTICLRGRLEGEFLILEIENDGNITREDEEKIRHLLADDYDISRENSESLGIANVNQRLRILYGAPGGLEMERLTENTMIARLTIRQKNSEA